MEIYITDLGTEITSYVDLLTTQCPVTLRGGGRFLFSYIDWDFTNYATILAYQGELIFFIEENDTKYFHVGIITRITQMRNVFIFEGHEEIRRLLNITCGFNPLYFSGVIDALRNYTTTFRLLDRDAGFTLNEHANRLVSISDADFYKTVFEVKEVSFKKSDHTTAFTPQIDYLGPYTSTAGDLNFLYWSDDDWDGSSGTTSIYGGVDCTGDPTDINAQYPESNWRLKVTFRGMIKASAANISKMTLFLDYYTKFNVENTDDHPVIEFFDFQGFTYDEYYDQINVADMSEFKEYKNTARNVTYMEGTAGFSFYLTPLIQLEIDMLEIQSDPLNTTMNVVTATNALGWTEYELDMYIAVGDDRFAKGLFDSGSYPDKYFNAVFVKYARIEFEFGNGVGTPHAQVYGVGKIDSNLSAIAYDMSLNTTFNSNRHLYIDGVVPGDGYHISDDLETIIDTVWSTNSLTDYFTLDRGNETTKGELENLTDKYIFHYLTKVAEMQGWEFWTTATGVAAGNRTVHLRAAFVSTSLVINEDDIVGYLWNDYQLVRDADKYRDTLIVVGSYGVRYSKTLSPDVATGRVEVYNRPEIVSQQQAIAFADSNTTRHEKEQVFAIITIDYTQSSVDYSVCDVGKTIGLQLGGGNKANYTSGNDGELLIIEMHPKVQASGHLRVTLFLDNRNY